MDLEWNNMRWKNNKLLQNEIIEIGAAKLDEDLKIIDTFRVYVKPTLYKELHPEVVKLTKITTENLQSGFKFSQALKHLQQWTSDKDNIFCTWGIDDFLELRNNCQFFNCDISLDWMNKFINLQQYISDLSTLPAGLQLSLKKAVELFDINQDNLEFHNALDDSKLCAKLLIKAYDPDRINDYVSDIMELSEEILHKKNWNKLPIDLSMYPNVDRFKLIPHCKKCGRFAKRISKWSFSKGYLRTTVRCRKCRYVTNYKTCI